jgi:hypothetical protein
VSDDRRKGLLLGFGLGFFVASLLISRMDKRLIDEAFARMTEAEVRPCETRDLINPTLSMDLEHQIAKIRAERGWPPMPPWNRRKRTRPVR